MLLGTTFLTMSQIASSLPILGLSLVLAALLGACAIEGPPDGFLDEGEGGYSATDEGDEGGAGVVGDPTSTSGINEEDREDWDDWDDEGEGAGDFADGVAEHDLLAS